MYLAHKSALYDSMYLLVLVCIADSNLLFRNNKVTDIRAHEAKDYFQIFNVYGSVHRNNILIYIQQDATLHSLFYLKTALYI
jgi:hypothetical protein